MLNYVMSHMASIEKLPASTHYKKWFKTLSHAPWELPMSCTSCPPTSRWHKFLSICQQGHYLWNYHSSQQQFSLQKHSIASWKKGCIFHGDMNMIHMRKKSFWVIEPHQTRCLLVQSTLVWWVSVNKKQKDLSRGLTILWQLFGKEKCMYQKSSSSPSEKFCGFQTPSDLFKSQLPWQLHVEIHTSQISTLYLIRIEGKGNELELQIFIIKAYTLFFCKLNKIKTL